jgi:hypothetical protein
MGLGCLTAHVTCENLMFSAGIVVNEVENETDLFFGLADFIKIRKIAQPYEYRLDKVSRGGGPHV